MKFLSSFILMAVLSFAAGLYLPWWVVAITCFAVVALIPQRPWAAFFCGFLSVGILWTVLSFLKSSANHHMLARKVSMLIIQIEQPYLLILVSALIGALVAAFGALTASFLKEK
ncbi:MAG: hypothetical protein WEA59_08365 [Ferruginibacter sp.]